MFFILDFRLKGSGYLQYVLLVVMTKAQKNKPNCISTF